MYTNIDLDRMDSPLHGIEEGDDEMFHDSHNKYVVGDNALGLIVNLAFYHATPKFSKQVLLDDKATILLFIGS